MKQRYDTSSDTNNFKLWVANKSLGKEKLVFIFMVVILLISFVWMLYRREQIKNTPIENIDLSKEINTIQQGLNIDKMDKLEERKYLLKQYELLLLTTPNDTVELQKLETQLEELLPQN